jgi:integrase
MRNQRTLTVLIFTRKINLNPDKLTIYARITVNSKRAEISLKRFVHRAIWDESKGRVIGNSQKARLLNGYLDEVCMHIFDAQRQLLREQKFITAKAVKARFLGLDEQHKTLLELVGYHNQNMVSILKPGTMKNYYSTERYLVKFLNEQLQTNDIYLKKLNYKFIVDFEHYIRNYSPKKPRKTCSNNGTMKHLERLMKMTNLAVKLEWLPKDPFKNYKLKFKKTERSYLTQREIDLIEATQFMSTGYERVKDVFLFACYTGLSYQDVYDLTIDNLVVGIDGNSWLLTKRAKTNVTVKIPLLPKAKEIIHKYEKDRECEILKKLLPVYSNQKVNFYLKEIAKVCKIYKHLTFHVARHTFATTVTLQNGVPIETVSKLLGHTKLTTTQIYARVLEKKVGEDMQSLISFYQNRNNNSNKSKVSKSLL